MRIVEITVCTAFVLLMSMAAAETPGTAARLEEAERYFIVSFLLMFFATGVTILNRDLWFRILIYPMALLVGLVLLLIDIKYAYGYEWDSFWKSFPVGVGSALCGFSYIFFLNGVIPFCWRKLTGRRGI